MNQFLLAALVVLGGASYYLWNENKILTANNAKLETAIATQEEAIKTMKNDFALQTSSLLNLQSKNQEIEAEMNRYLDIFKRHNLTKLAKAKPGLIETRANKGTKDVFDSIEKDTAGIDSLDDGLQLQPDTK